jgi:hypothetical protein
MTTTLRRFAPTVERVEPRALLSIYPGLLVGDAAAYEGISSEIDNGGGTPYKTGHSAGIDQADASIQMAQPYRWNTGLAIGNDSDNVTHTLTAKGADPRVEGDMGARQLRIAITQTSNSNTTTSGGGGTHIHRSLASTGGLSLAYDVVDSATGQPYNWGTGTVEVIGYLIVNYQRPAGNWVSGGPVATGYQPNFTATLSAEEANGNAESWTLAGSYVSPLAQGQPPSNGDLVLSTTGKNGQPVQQIINGWTGPGSDGSAGPYGTGTKKTQKFDVTLPKPADGSVWQSVGISINYSASLSVTYPNAAIGDADALGSLTFQISQFKWIANK